MRKRAVIVGSVLLLLGGTFVVATAGVRLALDEVPPPPGAYAGMSDADGTGLPPLAAQLAYAGRGGRGLRAGGLVVAQGT